MPGKKDSAAQSHTEAARLSIWEIKPDTVCVFNIFLKNSFEMEQVGAHFQFQSISSFSCLADEVDQNYSFKLFGILFRSSDQG